MANNYGYDQEVIQLYACVCGETLTNGPGKILECCIENGLGEDEEGERKEGDSNV